MTTNAQHTPGPWTAHPGNVVNFPRVARVVGNWDVIAESKDGSGKANAALIASAPELLEALRETLHALEYFNEREGCPGLLDQVNQAIRHAEGD